MQARALPRSLAGFDLPARSVDVLMQKDRLQQRMQDILAKYFDPTILLEGLRGGGNAPTGSSPTTLEGGLARESPEAHGVASPAPTTSKHGKT